MSLKESLVVVLRESAAGPEGAVAANSPAGAAALLLVPEWAMALRLQQPLSLIVVTADAPRSMATPYRRDQHEAQLLRLGQLLDATAGRARDAVGRCSADAFMILLPETPVDGARAVALRCQRAIAEAQLPTASFGAGTLIPRSEAGHSIFFNAVAQLCDEAARAGGDRIVARHFGQTRSGLMRA